MCFPSRTCAKKRLCYISMKSLQKKSSWFLLEICRKSDKHWIFMILQATHVAKNVHTSLTGRPKCKNRWFYYGKTRFLQNFIPTEHGKHEKMLIFCWKYVKVDFWNTSRARTSKKITIMRSNLVKIMISGPQK